MWISVEKVFDLAPESARVVRAHGEEIALVHGKDGIFALYNVCPHSGGPLGEGLVQGNKVTCPMHGWEFDCKTGTCLTEKRLNQRQYPVKIENDEIRVELPEPSKTAGKTDSAASESKPLQYEWLPAAEINDFTPGTVKKAEINGRVFALVCTSDRIYAVNNRCPHESGPLGEGSVEDGAVVCPLHSYKFDCKTGKCLTDSRLKAEIFETKIEDNKIWIRVPQRIAEEEFSTQGAPKEEPDPAKKKSSVEIWKTEKHGIDAWPDILRYAKEATPMAEIDTPELERMKWYGYFYRKNNDLDRYMVRIRIPGCEMTSAQARAIAFITYESGYSIADVTTRGNIQVQGLTIEKLPGVREALERVGLTSRQSGHDNVRNVTSHPLSGVDPEELIDTRELAKQIQEMIIGNREFSDLPRKFNIALTGRNETAVHTWTQDIGFVACNFKDIRQMADGPNGRTRSARLVRFFFRNEIKTRWGWQWLQARLANAKRVGFHLLLGGNQGQAPKLAWHIPVFVLPEQVLDVTAAILRTFRELGYRHNRHEVRFSSLINRIGPEKTLAEIEKRLEYQLIKFDQAPPNPVREEDFIGWFKQKQENLWVAGICVPLGRLTWEQLVGLSQIAQIYGARVLRTTYDQNLMIPGIPTESRKTVASEIAKVGLSCEADSIARNVVACTGKQFCNLAVTETKGYAFQLIENLRRRYVQLHKINIHMSGCPSSCAMTYTADIGLKGTKVRQNGNVVDTFDIYLGGGVGNEVQMGILYQMRVRILELPHCIETIVEEYYKNSKNGETFSQYWREKLKEHKADKSQQEIPKWVCTQCGHIHVAEDPPVFCPVCSALRRVFEPAPEDLPASQSGSLTVRTGDGKVGDQTTKKPEDGEKQSAISSKEPSLWICKSCGLKHGGIQPPEICPVCGVKGSEFHMQKADDAGTHFQDDTLIKRKAPSGKKILIVGGSIGGHTAAQTVRELDSHAQITLVTDEKHSFYNRLSLTRFLSEEIRNQDLFDYTSEWYEEKQIEVLTGTRVIGLNPANKTALLSEGREITYDSCILCHGSSANTPPFYRENLPGLLLFRTLDDVEKIIKQIQPGLNVAIIGGGVLGLEAAYGIKKRGAAVRVFEFFPYLMPRQLDKESARIFQEMVEEKGIECFVGSGVKEIVGRTESQGLILSDGRQFQADLIIVSTGIKPNIDWVKQSGIHCNRGILVNDRMQTSAEGVYAAGDVAEWQGQVVGLWTNAIEQAKVAATNAVGKMAFFQGFLPVTILKCLGIPLISMGEIKEDGDGISSRVQHDPQAKTLKRIILRSGIPIGGILLGTSAGMGEMRKLIENGIELEKLKKKILPVEKAHIPAPALSA